MAILTVPILWTAVLAQQDSKGDARKERKRVLPKCPVMPEEDVDFFVSTQTDDGPVFFCCKGCIEKFLKEPPKYAKGVAAQREALAKLPRVQVTCPVSGEAVDRARSVESGGQRVYFCCERCIGTFQAQPAKYQSKLAASYTYQTECPVDKAPIEPVIALEVAGGHKIYFDRAECRDAFKRNPERYLSNLAAQGITLEAEDVQPASPKQ